MFPTVPPELELVVVLVVVLVVGAPSDPRAAESDPVMVLRRAPNEPPNALLVTN